MDLKAHPHLNPPLGGGDQSLPPTRGQVRACPELAEGMGVEPAPHCSINGSKIIRPKRSLRLSLKLILALAGLAISLLLASAAFADFSQTEWRYLKPISLPPEVRKVGLVELLPDPEVFASSSPGMADLRVVAGEGVEVPYKFEVSQGEHQQTSFSATLRDQSYVPGRYNIFTAELDRQGVLHNEIAIQTPTTNFRRTATVEASNDGVTWARIAQQPIYDFTLKERGFSTRNTRVRYPDSTARYLRVQVADEGEGPLEMGGATVFLVKETPAREVRWPATLQGISRDAERRATLVEFELGAPGLPSHRLGVIVPEVNFYREVDLEVSSDREQWRKVASRAPIYAYDTPKLVGSSLALTYSETTARYFRLTIFDADNPPLTVQGIDVWGLQRRLVFSADPGQSYNLYYGSPQARRPSYDIELVFPYLEAENLPQARLGPQVGNPQFVEPEPPLPPPVVEPKPPPLPVSERLPWLLPVVVAVAAVMVGLLILLVLRQARKVLPPPAQ